MHFVVHKILCFNDNDEYQENWYLTNKNKFTVNMYTLRFQPDSMTSSFESHNFRFYRWTKSAIENLIIIHIYTDF